MPKDTKRAATRRAAKIAKAHATELPVMEVKAPSHRAPGGKRPARGLARYPWATAIILILVAAGVWASWHAQIGPFAPYKPAPVVKVTPTATPATFASSPCNSSTVVKEITDTAAPMTTAQFNKIKHSYSSAPAMTINTKQVYCVGLNTNRGLIVLELDPSLAPNTVNNFVYLAQNHFYDGMKFYRVLPNAIVQTGSPAGSTAAGPTGGPGYTFKDEPVKGDYTQGCVAMANSGANTNGSQFFLCTGDESKTFSKSYNLFGKVTMGMNIALKLQGPGDDSTSANIKPDTLNYVKVEAVNPS
jgi:cyclophilin family peptidyl-prolyl cis-trans isomerase